MRIKQSSWRPMLVTPSASLRVVEALRPRTTWSTYFIVISPRSLGTWVRISADEMIDPSVSYRPATG